MIFLGVILGIPRGLHALFMTGMDPWIPAGIAGDALLLFIGVAVMGASEKVPAEHGEHATSDHHEGPMVVEKRVEEHH